MSFREKSALISEMKALASGDAAWREGKVFALVYHAGEEHEALLKEAHGVFFSENGLNPMAFQSLRHMEGDVVRMTASMLNGDENTVGTMSSGGTESILLAVKTYRDRARRLKPWVRRPEMVIPRSAHVAFLKAGELFDVKVRIAPLREDYCVDVKAMKRLINRNTIMLVGSAPQYVQGVLDDIDLDVRAGEILGICGMAGSGRTELLRALIDVFSARAPKLTVLFSSTSTAIGAAGQVGYTLFVQKREHDGYDRGSGAHDVHPAAAMFTLLVTVLLGAILSGWLLFRWIEFRYRAQSRRRNLPYISMPSQIMSLIRGQSYHLLEKAVIDQHPAVFESATVGVPDEMRGQRVVAFADRELGPLLARDANQGTRLVELLRCFCEHGGNKSAAAAAAHLSRTAYYQQLSRIEQVLGVSLEDPESVLSLYVALLVHEMGERDPQLPRPPTSAT